jgi:protein gp37
MAETSGIAWTRSTFNPWIGCTKVGPGCDGCYAEVSPAAKFMGVVWGPDGARRRTGVKNWNLPLRWNRQAAKEREAGIRWHPDMPPGFWPVFCASLADVFDNEVPDDWRRDLFSLIELTPNLSWLLVTKRIGNVKDMVRKARTHDWLEGRKNVRLLITVVNQEEADRDIPKLLALPCKNGISYEPALGPVDWTRYLCPWNHGENRYGHRLEWIIVGGESSQPGHPARPFDIGWARSTLQQCKAAGVPVFMKQAGSFVIDRNDAGFEGDGDDLWPAGTADKLAWNPFGWSDEAQGSPVRIKLKDRAGADPDEWPEDLRLRKFPL